MDIESTTQLNKAEFFSHWGICLKALPSNFKSKMINVTRSIKNIGQDDPKRVIHSLKMRIALTLVSLIYYSRPLYDGFGLAGMCVVLTVVFVFEFTVGETLNKGLNGRCATLLAGALGFGGQHLATVFGERGETFVLGTLVFILVAGSTFFRFFPKIKVRYDYGVVTFILTFCLVTVSGYRVEQLFELVHQSYRVTVSGYRVSDEQAQRVARLCNPIQ